MIFHKKTEAMYKSTLFKRYDGSNMVKYFTHKDFEGLEAKDYSFKSSHGHTLKGKFYSYPGCKVSPLVIFEHGLGGGHISYMKEIEKLCGAGYLVFSYDHTGCMESGGEGTNGIAQSLCDLDDCLNALEQDSSVCTDTVYVVGHSWGGYSTMNIASLHKNVKKAVVLAGIVSVKRIIDQLFTGIARLYRNDIYKLEKAANPSHAEFDGIETLKNTDVKGLLIYSSNDYMINKEVQYDPLYRALKDNSRITLMLEDNKGHNPNYTHSAVKYLSELNEKTKNAGIITDRDKAIQFRDSFDWEKMTAQDQSVWDKIFEFLGSANE